MTERTTNILTSKEGSDTFSKLSIQVSLNGLSFCVLDTLNHTILAAEQVTFTPALTLHALLKELKSLLHRNDIVEQHFSEVTVIHKNKLFSLVPQPLFDENELPHYLKFNARLMVNDHIAYEEIPHQDIINVYVPYTNVNNYIFDCFGEFEYKHSGTILITALLQQNRTTLAPVCYVQIATGVMEMGVLSDKKLLFYNQFEYNTPEDFLFYLLFSLEQAQVDLTKVQLHLSGKVAVGDFLYKGCCRYIKNVSVGLPNTASYHWKDTDKKCIDFMFLNTL